MKVILLVSVLSSLALADQAKPKCGYSLEMIENCKLVKDDFKCVNNLQCGRGGHCCQNRCDKDSCYPGSACYVPQVTGPCRLYIPRWYFNYRTGECQQFIYGGCQGNKNNFATYEQCSRRCAFQRQYVCYMPKAYGPCKASIKKWYYNHYSNKCEQFSYGGCGGNGNNFWSFRECFFRCGSQAGLNFKND